MVHAKHFKLSGHFVHKSWTINGNQCIIGDKAFGGKVLLSQYNSATEN